MVNYITLTLGATEDDVEGCRIRVRASDNYYGKPWYDAVQVLPRIGKGQVCWGVA